jgi:parvulin-like peptidyl-prolyl isomerase
MVEEFDKVVFEKPVGVVHKVRTQFGWHLVLTTSRSGMPEDLDEDVEDMKADL